MIGLLCLAGQVEVALAELFVPDSHWRNLFGDQISQDAFRGDARCISFDRRLGARRLAGILQRLLELLERNENLRPAFHNGFCLP
jgi:hypothetical protein